MTTAIKLNNMDEALKEMGIKEVYHPAVKAILNRTIENITESVKEDVAIVITNKEDLNHLKERVEFSVKYNTTDLLNKLNDLLWDDIETVGNNVWKACEEFESGILIGMNKEFESYFNK